MDLPRDLKSSASTKSALTQVTQQVVDRAKDLELADLFAATAALVLKYTQQEDFRIGLSSLPGTSSCAVDLADASEQSLDSLRRHAREALERGGATNNGASVQVAVAAAPLSPDVVARWPALELAVSLPPRRGGGLVWSYRPDLFSDQWIARAQAHLVEVLGFARDKPLKELSVLTQAERADVLHGFNRTAAVVPPSENSVLDAVAKAVRAYGDRIAVDAGRERLTYQDLWDISGRLAAALREKSQERRPVAVLLDRGPLMVASLLAVWRSGGACMPLDVRTPRARLERLLADVEARVAITRPAFQESFSWLPCSVVLADDYVKAPTLSFKRSSAVKDPGLKQGDLAYVLFTSGSTGVPKGVMLSHGNLLSYIGWHIPYYGLSSEDAVPHLAGLSFDASMAEIWPTLAVGGRVVPALDEDIRLLPEALCNWFAESGITVAFLTTQLAETVLLEPKYPANMRLRTLFTGGDKLHFGASAKAPFKLVNIYGPTECTVNVTLCSVPAESGPPPIGFPVPGCRLLVLDKQLRPQPPGIFGELFIGGLQVGLGYIAKPDLTAERFVPDPFASEAIPASADVVPALWPTGPCWEERLGPTSPSAAVPTPTLAAKPSTRGLVYRTGDLVRWTQEGSLDFLGRADSQVKIRGQRIELGEIEARLLQHPAVREACVVCRNVKADASVDKYLVAYWIRDGANAVDEGSDADSAEQVKMLRSWLRAELPEYMVPKAVMRLEKFPVNANGKVDRPNLPEPTLDAGEGEEEVPADGPLEERLRSDFDQVLGRSGGGVCRSFFDLGGHSLSVGRLVNRVCRDLNCQLEIRDVYAYPSVRELAKLLKSRGVSATNASAASAIDAAVTEGKDLEPVYAATFQQQALYEMAQLGSEASQALNLAFVCQVRGVLDVPRLRLAFEALAYRHDALRSTFRSADVANEDGEDGKLTCEVHESACLDFEVLAEEKADLAEWILDEQYKTFDLNLGPLCRVRILKEANDAWVLHWTLHHTAADLWSYTILLEDLEHAYTALAGCHEIDAIAWPSPAPQYRSCAIQQAERLKSGAGAVALQYWTSKLDPAPPALELPTDMRPNAGQKYDFKGSKVDFELPASLCSALESLGRRCGATSVYPVLLAAWMALLSRFGEEDVCVGIPMACRTTPEAEQAVGYFVNPLCVRVAVSGTFEALVAAVAADVRDVLQHQCVPLSNVCEKLGLNERKLLQAMFVYQTSPKEKLASVLPSFFMGHAGSQLPFADGLSFESFDLAQRHAQFEIALMLAPGPRGHLIGSFQYSSSHFSRSAVLQLQSQYQRILEAVISSPKKEIDTIQLFGDAEVQQLRRRSETPWPMEMPTSVLPALLAAKCEQIPGEIAVVGPDGTYTYGQILNRAEQVAQAIRAQQAASAAAAASAPAAAAAAAGAEFSPSLESTAASTVSSGTGASNAAGENALVGIMVSPGLWMVAGALGAWLAGRGYFPIDPGHPFERIQQMVQDAEPQCILCQDQFSQVAQALGVPTLPLETLSSTHSVLRQTSPRLGATQLPGPDDRGFLVFTSGSTGRPKAVVLSFRSLLAHALFTARHVNLKQGQTVLQHTAWTFDAHICEIYPALLHGASVVIAKREGSKDFKYMRDLVDEHRICHALFVPSLLAEILESAAMPRSVRSVATVGEATTLSLAARILEAPLTLHNFYGPSEGGIGATIYDIDKVRDLPSNAQTVPIGRSVAWHQVVLLDAKLRPTVSNSGQMAILGEGLALGYLKNPEETAKKFLQTPKELQDMLPNCGSRMYLTGDAARYVGNDLLEFVGRLDHQVKLRGQRIELGEIEAALLSLNIVTEAVALVRGERLIAYFSTLQDTEESEALARCGERTHERLPRYMWPELVYITEWPRGRTGKVDRKALPMPREVQQNIVAPRSALESTILGFVCQVLKRTENTTSVTADFFSLGGTSLRAATLLSLLRSRVGEAAGLQFSELYAHPSAAALAAFLGSKRETFQLGPAPTEGFLPASYGQEHMLMLQELRPDSGAYNSPLLLRLDGPLDRAALAGAVEQVIRRHDVLRTNLVRDFINSEPVVVQLTTPAAECMPKMEYWPAPSPPNTLNYPVREPLRPQRARRGASKRSAAPASPTSMFSTPDVIASASPLARRRPSLVYDEESLRWGSRGSERQGSYFGYSSPTAGSPRLQPRRASADPDGGFEFMLEFDEPAASRQNSGPQQCGSFVISGMSAIDLPAARGRSSSSFAGPSGSSNNLFARDQRATSMESEPEMPALSYMRAYNMLIETSKTPFDLRDDWLVRVVLAQVSPTINLLLINCHHAVTDGRSMMVLKHELAESYRALLCGRRPSLPRLPVQYADFAYWQRQWMAQGQMDQQLSYWEKALEGLETLQLPTDFPRPADLQPDGESITVQIESGTVKRLRSLLRTHGVTLYSALLSAFAVALGRYGNATDVAIASPVGNRDGPELEQLVGYFVNTVIFRLRLGNSNFEQLLQQAKDVVIKAFEHAQAPYASVLEAAKLDPTAIPAMFALQDTEVGDWGFEGLQTMMLELPRKAALFDVTMELFDSQDKGLSGYFVYNTNLWTSERASQFVATFKEITNAMVIEPSVELPLLSAAPSDDRVAVLNWGNHGKRPSPTPLCVEAFQSILKRHWKRPALVHGDQVVTYAQFGVGVSALAGELRNHPSFQKAVHAGQELIVAVLLNRSVEMAIAIWGTLCAGAAYVPIDPEYPADRIGHIIANAQPQLFLCRQADVHLCGEVPALVTEKWAIPSAMKDANAISEGMAQLATCGFNKSSKGQLAYIIYTSGTTGRPKGVAVEHGAVANMIYEQIRLMRITYKDRVMQFFKPAFDGAVQEYLSTPAAGAALVLWDSNESFSDVLRDKQVSIATLTPSALSVLDVERLPELQQVGTAAEACPPSLIDTWTRVGRRVVNAYGPSENCVVSTFAELAPDSKNAPIGRPLEGVSCYIYEPTRCRSLQPIGVPGELCLGGVQLARGYYGDEAKTEEKFVGNHLDGARMYRSGDIAAWNSVGQLLYIGRNDEMVKVRGFRVELTEVESALAAAGAMSVSVGLNKTKDSLWAWCTLAPQVSIADLKEGIQKTLPQYMIPQRIFALDSLPLTSNGKIDKRKLLDDATSGAMQQASDASKDKEEVYVAPATPLETQVCTVVATVLGLEKIGVTEGLVAAGMSSLKQVLLSQRLRDVGLEVPLSMLYELTTPRAVADWLQAERREGSFVVAIAGDNAANSNGSLCVCQRVAACVRQLMKACLFFYLRVLAWCWISGVVIWPAVPPLWLVSHIILPKTGLPGALSWLILAAYPLYVFGVALLVVLTKWLVIGHYRATSVPTDSFMFFRWWLVDRLFTYTCEVVIGPLRGGVFYYSYLRCLGLRASGYSRIDAKSISEFDLITLGRNCVVAEGAKLRPAVVEAGQLHLRSIVFGDTCAVGENSVCTAGAVAGTGVTLQPLSMFSGRTGRTLPDCSLWKGVPLVQSRQSPVRLPEGIFCKDWICGAIGLFSALAILVLSSFVGYAVFGSLASLQGLASRDAEGHCIPWNWRRTPQGWLFSAVWLLYGPPVMASADVLLGYDLTGLADGAAACLGERSWLLGLRVVGMVVVSFAAYGWALTLASAILCRHMRGSRNRNAFLYQVRRVVLRMTFPRYPAQLNGTAAMALYVKLLGGSASMSATVSFAEPPLEPRKLRIGEGAVFMNACALGDCTIGCRSIVGPGAVLLPHAEVEAHAMVGGGSVAGRPVLRHTALASNPGIIVKRPELRRPPSNPKWFRLAFRTYARLLFPVLAPMLTQTVLLIALLPAMYALTAVLDSWSSRHPGAGGFIVLCLALSPVYVLLGVSLAAVAVVFKWILLGRLASDSRWQWLGSSRSYVLAFVQSLVGLASAIFMSMAYGTPVYNIFLSCLGARIDRGAIILSPIAEFDNVHIGRDAVIDREAVVTGQRMLAASNGPSEFAVCFAKVRVGVRSTISIAATVVGAETGELSVLAPLSALGPSTKLPTRTLAIGSPPQKFVWSKDRDNIIKPSGRPVPRELGQELFLPYYVRRALSRMKVRVSANEDDGRQVALVTGAGGFLGRNIVAALLEKTQLDVVCLVRAKDAASAEARVRESLRKAGVASAKLADRVQALRGDLSQRQFGLSLIDFQRLAGQVSHVFNSAAKVNLAEPFESMKKDNVEATAYVIEFCCTGRHKQLHHVSTMGVLTPDMLNRRGVAMENAPLGNMRTMPLYGTGDQANGYPYTKWCAERMVFEAGRKGLPVFVHRAGLIGGDSRSGAVAEDVFFHFLSDIVTLRELPDMEGDKFNITPVDWVAKAIVHVATTPSYARFAGSAVHPAAAGNTVTMPDLADELRTAGYSPLRWVDFWEWRERIVADPERFKSWSFCAALSVEGNGIDSMAGNDIGFQAMREAVGEEVDHFDPRLNLSRMISFCQESGLLPRPGADLPPRDGAAAQPLLSVGGIQLPGSGRGARVASS